jgi:chromosomal replication initiation ATPase DnaA
MLTVLQKKTKSSSFAITEDCQHFIAANTHDVRSLEGAVTLLTAYSSLCDAPVCLHTAQRVLSHMSAPHG